MISYSIALRFVQPPTKISGGGGGGCLIKPKEHTDSVTSNIIDKQSTNHSKYFKALQCTSEIYKYSFFPGTIINWNHLDDNIVPADTVESFRRAVQHWD